MPIRSAVAVVMVLLPVLAAATDEDEMTKRREKMVRDQIEARGVRSPQVLDALRSVQRHLFVPDEVLEGAYEDHPLPIGHKATISQPYIVGLMTETLALDPEDRVLEIGTGSGYQAAVLSLLCRQVYSIEIVPELGMSAQKRLRELGYDNVAVRIGDGYHGWPEESPFDAIIVTAAPPEIPEELVNQLDEGGRMVLPIGTESQELVLLTREHGEIKRSTITMVRFVPMVKGEDGKH